MFLQIVNVSVNNYRHNLTDRPKEKVCHCKNCIEILQW